LRQQSRKALAPIPSVDDSSSMHLSIETEREEDGRWLAEVPELPGVLAYGATAEDAAAKAEILALRVLADRLEHGEAKPVDISISFATA
jgi:predicted RNase H-like HicB family nuclease